MKQPLSSTALVLVTAGVLAYSSYRMNRYCLALPIARVGCKIMCTVPHTIVMKQVITNRHVLVYLLLKKLGYTMDLAH